MQCNLTFYIFVSSSLFFLEVVVNVFDYFWKPNSLFSKFCVNCLLIFYFVYCNNCVLNDVNGACWCTCSLVALSVLEMCFWPAKARRNLELFEMHTCHWPGAQIWFRHKWWKLVTASFCLLVLIGKVVFIIEMSFFSCGLGFRLKFSRIALWRKRLQLDSKNSLATNGFFLGVFCWKMASFVDFISVWTEICKNCSTFFFFDDIHFFQFLIWGVFWSVL